jgi:zinc transport system permease protein
MLLLGLFYNDLTAICFNEDLARTSGIRVSLLNNLLAILTALTVVLAMKLVGIMLISALLILPAATALHLARGFKIAVILSVTVAVLAVVGGILASVLFNLPTGATIILLAFLMFCLALVLGRFVTPDAAGS